MAGELWNSQPSLHDATAIVPAKLTLLNNAVIAACDANDGIVIADPRTCMFNPAVLQCTGADAPNCLTAAQVGAAQQIYAGAKQSNGTVIFPPYPRGSELGWTLYAGTSPGGSGFDFFRYTVFQDPTFNNANFNFDADFNRAKASTIAGQRPPFTRHRQHRRRGEPRFVRGFGRSCRRHPAPSISSMRGKLPRATTFENTSSPR